MVKILRKYTLVAFSVLKTQAMKRTTIYFTNRKILIAIALYPNCKTTGELSIKPMPPKFLILKKTNTAKTTQAKLMEA